MADIALTDEERANGWTEETLREYVDERHEAQLGVITFDPEFRPRQRARWANGKYNPLRWRR